MGTSRPYGFEHANPTNAPLLSSTFIRMSKSVGDDGHNRQTGTGSLDHWDPMTRKRRGGEKPNRSRHGRYAGQRAAVGFAISLHVGTRFPCSGSVLITICR